MDLRGAVGQLFMIGFQGVTVTAELRDILRRVRPGGLILFKRNVEHPLQIAELCSEAQKEAGEGGSPPLFISIDQEGGVVARLDEPFTRFPSQGEMPHAHYEEIFKRGALMARELTLVGLNMNLAPVLDVRRPDDVTKNFLRSFSEDPHRVATLGVALIRGLQRNGVMACAKHFPGLGRARVDPHVDLPVVDGDLETDLIPFQGAVSQDVSAVMMSHAVYPAVDSTSQASLSQAVVEGLLRRRLGHRGLVITDDLEMGAVAKSYTPAECSLAAFRAGADVLLICSRLEEIPACFEAVLEAVTRDPDLQERLKISTHRISRAKNRYLVPYRPPDHRQIATYFSLGEGRAAG
jgi:beta-N-acetylhexosaminidase